AARRFPAGRARRSARACPPTRTATALPAPPARDSPGRSALAPQVGPRCSPATLPLVGLQSPRRHLPRGPAALLPARRAPRPRTALPHRLGPPRLGRAEPPATRAIVDRRRAARRGRAPVRPPTSLVRVAAGRSIPSIRVWPARDRPRGRGYAASPARRLPLAPRRGSRRWPPPPRRPSPARR